MSKIAARLLIGALLLAAVALYAVIDIFASLRPEIHRLTIKVPAAAVPDGYRGKRLRVAVLGDLHVPDSEVNLEDTRRIIEKVMKQSPDLVLLVGDYTAHPRSVRDMDMHRRAVVSVLTGLKEAPTVAVMGNYESWSDAAAWLNEFKRQNIMALENEVRMIPFTRDAGMVCVRGLGDMFTRRFKYIDFPPECDDGLKLTITHDPAGAFDDRVRGLVFAGHTHCGQISLPRIGPLWAPTRAPRAAYCGVYSDDQRTLFVTSGLGTSILPIRLGAQAQWDLVTLTTGGRSPR